MWLTALADAGAGGGDGEPAGAAHWRHHPRAPPRHDARPHLPMPPLSPPRRRLPRLCVTGAGEGLSWTPGTAAQPRHGCHPTAQPCEERTSALPLQQLGL